jgi:hypothetical protein
LNYEKLLLKASKHGSFAFLDFYTEEILPNVDLLPIDDRELDIIFFNEAFKYGQAKIIEWFVSEEAFIGGDIFFREVGEIMTEREENLIKFVKVQC